MPRIPDVVLNTVFFVYPNEEAANAGKPIGGTGFLVTLPSSVQGAAHLYGISTWHLTMDQGASVIRINRKGDRAPQVFPFDVSDWTAHPDGCDIAAIPLPMLSPAVHDIAAIPLDEFAGHAGSFNKGLGDNVFMVGRFVDHDGAATNAASVRFGNIAVMPTPMDQGRKKMRESYCIDLHSRTGYSGSPVYIYRSVGDDLDAAHRSGGSVSLGATVFLHLLGIHWSQFPEWKRVIKTRDDDDDPAQPQVGWLKLYSGMTCVVPAERILELLNIPELKKQRAKAEAALHEVADKH